MSSTVLNYNHVVNALLSQGTIIISEKPDWLEIKRALDTLSGIYDGKTAQNEALTFCHFLLYANSIGRMPFPIEIHRSERPDFRISMVGESPFWGIEHTRATIEKFMQDCSELDKQPELSLIETSYYTPDSVPTGNEAIRKGDEPLRHQGYGDNDIEEQWTAIVLAAIKKKCARAADRKPFRQNDLLIHYVGPAPIFMRFDSGVAMLRQAYAERSCQLGCFQRVHIIIGSGNLFVWDTFGETIKIDSRQNV
jgi:hypothetical protein